MDKRASERCDAPYRTSSKEATLFLIQDTVDLVPTFLRVLTVPSNSLVKFVVSIIQGYQPVQQCYPLDIEHAISRDNQVTWTLQDPSPL